MNHSTTTKPQRSEKRRQPRAEPKPANRPDLKLDIEVLEERIAPAYLALRHCGHPVTSFA